MHESVCIFMTYCVLLYFLKLILSVCIDMSLCVCVWAMLPDSNKMMMIMMMMMMISQTVYCYF